MRGETLLRMLRWCPLADNPRGAPVRWYAPTSVAATYQLVRVMTCDPTGHWYTIAACDATSHCVPRAELKRHGRWCAEEVAWFAQMEPHLGRQWSRAARYLTSRSVQQIRTHAQKFYLRSQDSTNARLRTKETIVHCKTRDGCRRMRGVTALLAAADHLHTRATDDFELSSHVHGRN